MAFQSIHCDLGDRFSIHGTNDANSIHIKVTFQTEIIESITLDMNPDKESNICISHHASYIFVNGYTLKETVQRFLINFNEITRFLKLSTRHLNLNERQTKAYLFEMDRTKLTEFLLDCEKTQLLVNAYLSHLNLERKTPSLEYLRSLQKTHIETIPHENINGIFNLPASFAIEDLINKYTQERRGGMCFELNYSFGWLLHQLGFAVELKLSWVNAYNDAKENSPYPTHPIIIVFIERQQYITDVGWSDSYRHPLPLTGAVYDDIGGTGAYHVIPKDELRYVMQKRLFSAETKKWEWVDQFTLPKPESPLKTFRFPNGFLPGYVFTCIGPDYLFTHLFKFTKVQERGHRTIFGNRLFTRKGDEKSEVPLPPNLPQLLQDQFNIPPRIAKQCIKLTRSTSSDNLSFFRKALLEENQTALELKKSL